MSKASTVGKSLKNSNTSGTGVATTASVGEVVTLTISQGGFTLDDVTIISGTIDGVLIGGDQPAPGNFTSIISGTPAGVGYTSIFYGSTVGEFFKWDPVLGQVNVSGDLVISQSTDLGNIRIAGNTISTKNTNGDVIIDPNGTGGLVITGDLTQSTTTGNISFQSGNGGFSASVTDNAVVTSGKEIVLTSSQEQTLNSTNGDIIIQSGSSKSIGIISFVSLGVTPTLTSTGHMLEIGDEISVIGTNSTPVVNGTHTVTQVVDANNFKISPGFSVISSGNTGTFTKNTDIYLTASNNINIPYDVKLTFGADTNYVMASSSPLNEMNLVSNDDINITPKNNINIPDNKGLTFGGDTQTIKSVSGALTVTAANSIGLEANTSVTGTFNVSGTSTLNNTVIQDPIVTIGTQTVDTKDRGVEYKYGTSSLGYFGRDTTDDYFMYVPVATNTGDIISGDLGNAKFNIGSFNSLSVANGGAISTTSMNVCTITCATTMNLTGGTGINLNVPSGSRVSLAQGSIFALGANTITNVGNDTVLTSNGHIYLTTTADTILPTGKSLVFNGLAGSQRITATTTELNVNSSSYLNLNQVSGGVRLTEGLPLIFNTAETTKITGTESLDIAAASYINLRPSAGHVNLPVNKRLEFGSSSDFIGSSGSGNVVLNGTTFNSVTSGDTQITSSSGNILLTPSSYVKIPKNKSMLFGDATEFIKSDTLNNLSVSSLGEQNYSATNMNLQVSGYVNVPSGKQLRFGSTSENITGTSGNLALTAGTTNISGNLNVNGSTTVINSVQVSMKDPILTLGEGIVDGKDRGIEYRYGSNKLGFFGYDDSQQVFTFIPDASNTNEVISGAAGNVRFGSGTFTTVAASTVTTNTLTSTGNLTINPSGDISLSPSGGDVFVPANTNLNLGNSQLYSDGVDVNLDIPSPGKFNLGNTVISGDLEVTGNVIFPSLQASVERFTVSSGGSRNPENGVSFSFVSITGNGVATGTMPQGASDGYLKHIMMSSVSTNCSFELTFPSGRLVDAVSGSSNAKKMIFDRSGQSVSIVWDASLGSWLIVNAGGELVLI